SGKDLVHVHEAPVLTGHCRDATWQIESETLCDTSLTSLKACGLEMFRELFAAAEELERGAVGLDVDEEPPAPLTVHPGDVDHPGGHGAVGSVLSRLLGLGRLLAVTAQEAADDLVLKLHGVGRRCSDLLEGEPVHRAGDLDGQGVDPAVGADATLEDHL